VHTSSSSMGSISDDLAADAERVCETHTSWVFLRGDDAYKVYKPVSLGFLDFSSALKRGDVARAECELNKRLAPDVYRGVVPVTHDETGRHAIEGSGEVVDFAVHMRRLADDSSASALLARGELDVRAIDRVAEHLARFHARSQTSDAISAFGAPEAIAINVEENLAQASASLRALLPNEEARSIEDWQLRFLEEHAELFRARVAHGRVRDGHGDLRLEHVYFEGDRILVIDCIAFNDRFRYADVASDIAFLSMDLAFEGRVDLAERLLATYARETSDFELYALVDFYESYRAYVRGKIESMPHGSPARARRYFLLALAAERRPIVPPVLIAMGGILASGKSTLADHLGAAMGAPSINTDRVRKNMLGAGATEKLYEGSWSGAYDPAVTEKVYEKVYNAARTVIRSGRPAIVDASFRSAAMRTDAERAARELGVPFLFVECRVDPDLARERLRERAKGESVSDGRIEIFDDFMKKWEPVLELDPNAHVIVDTARPIEACVETLRARIPMWPA
jgi:uncharacterized protein